MQTAEGTSTAQCNDASSAISSATGVLARYPELALHASKFEEAAHDLLLPPLVVVMGAFNAGKSTLLNALLGRDLLNMNVLPATATVTMLRKGKAGEVFGHAKGVATRAWPLSELTLLSAEGDTESANIRQSLSFVEVPLENPLLDKVTLVDTPGLNSPNATHTRATEDFVHRAQAVLWIISCLQPLNEHERSWIEHLPAGIRVLVVINQIDQLDPEESPLPSLIERVKNNLQRPDVAVTAVSAKLALESFLRPDKKRLSESLWETFYSSMEREIIESAAGLRVRRAASAVLALVESLNQTIAREMLEAESYMVKAKGGDHYYEGLQQRIRSLSQVESQLTQSQDAVAAIQALAIPDDWQVSPDTRLKHQVLVGAVLALNSEQSALDRESASLNERFQSHSSEVRQLQGDNEAYSKSGFFGGAPIIFRGMKKKLDARGLGLESRNAILLNEQNGVYGKRRSLQEKRNRVKGDCAAFIDQIAGAIRTTMVSVVKESQDTVAHQRIAAAKLAEFKWLRNFASAGNGSFWSLQERIKPLSVDEVERVKLEASFSRLAQMMDSLKADTWSVSVPAPLVLPSPSQRLLPEEDQTPPVRVRWGAIDKDILAAVGKGLLIAAGLAVFFIIILFPRRPAPPPVASAPVVEVQQQKVAASAPLSPVLNDQDAIRAALSAEGYTADGAMTDIPGLAPDSTLHIQKVSCGNSEEACEKLFIFVGSRVVSSEKLDSAESLSSLTTVGPGLFSAKISQQLPDGTQSVTVAKYKWDGTNLSKTVEDAPTEVPDAIPSAPTMQIASDAASPSPNPAPVEPPQPTADDLNQQGLAFGRSGQYDLAIAAFSQGLSRDPGRADLYNNRGVMYENKGGYEKAIQDYDQSISLNRVDSITYNNRGNAYAKLGDLDRAIADYDQAIRLNPNLSQAINSRHDALLRQAQRHPANNQIARQPYLSPSSSNASPETESRRSSNSASPPPQQSSSYNETVQMARNAYQAKDLRGAYRLAIQARHLDSNSLPALELIQEILAQGGDPAKAEAAAFDAISHGGKAVFELQHYHAWPMALHPARLVITSSTLEYVPEAACKFGDFTIPLSAIESVEMRQNKFNAYLLDIKFDDSNEKKGKEAKGQISFSDPTSYLDANPSTYRVSSLHSISQQTARFTIIRDLILQEKNVS
jgi:small GTP-binding protein